MKLQKSYTWIINCVISVSKNIFVNYFLTLVFVFFDKNCFWHYLSKLPVPIKNSLIKKVIKLSKFTWTENHSPLNIKCSMSCLQNELFSRLRKRKVFVSFGITMVILLFLIFFINSSSSSKIQHSYAENLRISKHLDLKLVHVVSFSKLTCFLGVAYDLKNINLTPSLVIDFSNE